MLVDWLIFVLLCLILLYFVSGDIAGYVILRRTKNQAIETQMKDDKSYAGSRGAMAKQQYEAEKLANKTMFNMTAPILSTLGNAIAPEDFERLINNPFGIEKLLQKLEPILESKLMGFLQNISEDEGQTNKEWS